MSLSAIDAIIQRVNRELWIVTASDGARRGGLVATWVSSASLDRDRPVMIAGLAPNHFTSELADAGGALGLHLLTVEQLDTAINFALGSGRERDKFARQDLTLGATGVPLLTHCLAWLEGRIFHRVATGDRIFYWLDIVAGGEVLSGAPAREQDLFAAVTLEQKQQLLADRAADLALQRPWQQAWRAGLVHHLR